MADKDNDPVLYSLKELKDMPKSQQPGTQSGSIANVKPVNKKSGKGWASDDNAGSLLAGILDDTETDAQAERSRLQAELEAKRREEENQKRREEDAKRMEAERRIQEEQSRRQSAERKRASLVRAIEGPSEEELAAIAKAESESAARAEMERKLAEAEQARHEAERQAADAARQAKIREQQRLEAVAQNAANPAPTNRGALGLVAVLLIGFGFLVVVGGGVGAYFAFFKDSGPKAQTYAKATLKPTLVTSAAIDKAFIPIPTAVAAEDGEAVAGSRNNTRVRKGNARRNTKGGAKKNTKATGGKKKPKFNFDGGGGGGGGIVF